DQAARHGPGPGHRAADHRGPPRHPQRGERRHFGDQLRRRAPHHRARHDGRSEAVSEKILITEDDEDLAFVIREALVRPGYDAEVAPTAGALLDRLKASQYDLILLDVRLPDMDGLDAIPRVRDLAPETPIIVMTAHGTRQIAMNAVGRGAYDFFTKPLKMSEFQVVVARALDRRRLQQQVKVLRE